MKKLLFSFFLAITAFAVNAQQMNFTISGTTVTFSANTGSDWGSTPMYVYAYADATDTTPNGTGSSNLLGNWPGTEMTGTGPFTTSVDLATLFPAGTTISNIKFIYNNGGFGGTTYQNPGSGQPGFNSTDTSKASGWAPVTITSLGVYDLQSGKDNSVVANGKLFTSKKGNLEVIVYDYAGKIIKKLNVKSNGSEIDLNISQTGNYILQISNGTEMEVVKFRK